MSGNRLKKQLTRLVPFAVLALAVALILLTQRYSLRTDLTQTARNSLEPASVSLLHELEGPVSLTLYATEQDAKLGDIRRIVSEFVALYRRHKSDFNLIIVDPVKEAARAEAAGIQHNGEMVLDYQGRSEHLTRLNESVLTGTLLRLAHSGDQRVLFLSGHGERKPDGAANHDLGLLGKRLRDNGFQVESLNLAASDSVPEDCGILVLSQPRTDLLAGEVEALEAYVDRGGNLLWLLDPGSQHGLETVSESLGLLLPAGSVIDPAAAKLRAPQNWSLGNAYPPHAITREFGLITAFPQARPINWNDDTGWRTQPLVETGPESWVSRYPEEGNREFDRRHDTPGPVVIAAALQRDSEAGEQRVVVAGSGSFLANSYAGNGGNLDLGINMVNWLGGEDGLIALQPRPARDVMVELGQRQLNLITYGTLLVLPACLLGIGFLCWRRRNHA